MTTNRLGAAGRIAALGLCGLLLGPAWADEAGVLVIGAENDAAPWSYPDGQGYVNDVVRAVFSSASLPVRLEVMPYARCKALVQAGRLAGCFSASRTAELANSLLFPRQPVFEARNILVVASTSALRGCDPSNWGGAPRVGTVNGYEYGRPVEALARRGQIKAEASISEASNLRKLAVGRLDAAILNLDEVKTLDFMLAEARLPPGSIRPACDLGGEPAYVTFSPRHPLGPLALRSFEAGYDKLQRSGEIARLQGLWRDRLNAGIAKPATSARP